MLLLRPRATAAADWRWRGCLLRWLLFIRALLSRFYRAPNGHKGKPDKARRPKDNKARSRLQRIFFCLENRTFTAGQLLPEGVNLGLRHSRIRDFKGFRMMYWSSVSADYSLISTRSSGWR
jgi:hypothetical protein